MFFPYLFLFLSLSLYGFMYIRINARVHSSMHMQGQKFLEMFSNSSPIFISESRLEVLSYSYLEVKDADESLPVNGMVNLKSPS